MVYRFFFTEGNSVSEPLRKRTLRAVYVYALHRGSKLRRTNFMRLLSYEFYAGNLNPPCPLWGLIASVSYKFYAGNLYPPCPFWGWMPLSLHGLTRSMRAVHLYALTKAHAGSISWLCLRRKSVANLALPILVYISCSGMFLIKQTSLNRNHTVQYLIHLRFILGFGLFWRLLYYVCCLRKWSFSEPSCSTTYQVLNLLSSSHTFPPRDIYCRKLVRLAAGYAV